MTVSELLAILRDVDGDRIVVIGKDAGGNNYSPLENVDTGAYRAETTWSGRFGFEASGLTEEARRQGYGEEDVIEDGKPGICLWPVN